MREESSSVFPFDLMLQGVPHENVTTHQLSVGLLFLHRVTHQMQGRLSPKLL